MSDTEETTTSKGVAFAEPDEASGLSRKERKKLEKQQAWEAELKTLSKKSEMVNQDGDNPFSVTLEEGDLNPGSRNIVLNKVSVSVAGKVLFRETQVKLSAGQRYGLMGPNGRGKSTLLRLLSNRELPVPKNLDVLLVEQEQECHADDTPAVTAVINSHKTLKAYMLEAEELGKKKELTDEEMARLHFLEDELEHMGASNAEARARKILFGLGFPTDWHERPTKSFSGGWRKRVTLAAAVFIEPDVLMLDEPTNHLDLNAVIWLEDYLSVMYSETQKRAKTLVIVSHDAEFLDSVCSHMVHIENFQLDVYKGGYHQFVAQLETRREQLDKKFIAVQKQIDEKKRNGLSRKQVDEWLEVQVSQGKIAREYLEKRREYTVTFPFANPTALRENCIVKCEDVSFNYPGGPTLFTDVNISLWSDSRITLCGPNGIGKSTMLNLMTGILEPVTGHITVNRTVRIGRYNQHFIDKLPLERTPVDYLMSLGVQNDHEARKLLGSFGLEGGVHLAMIATLSGGQKARVAFAGISAERPHLLLFDEPTNHLDGESIEALCSAINNFKGGVLVVTHDARLIRETKMVLWVAGDLTVRKFDGELEEYKEYIRGVLAAEEAAREQERADKVHAKVQNKRDMATVASEAASEKERLRLVEQMREEEAKKKAEEAAKEADDFFEKADKKKKKKAKKAE